jgi:hypothetical protein
MKQFYLIAACISVLNLSANAQVNGCTDPAANNFNAAATVNNGSCTYNNTSLGSHFKYNLSSTLNETSGLLWWNGAIWTHNDSGGDPFLFAVDTTTGNITRTVTVTNAVNTDWEDIAQDDNYIYIGDFGNNANGNRTDLKIYKVSKSDVLAGDNVTAEIINFSYEDQTDFTPTGSNNTNFDCEAMITYGSSLFLFSKNWVNQQTKLYEVPNTAGTHTALKRAELNVQGLITGADAVANKRTIVLTGYSTTLTPFVYLLYDFSGTSFFEGNKRKVPLNATFTQMEGIAAIKSDHYFISNERFQQFVINTPAKFETLDLSGLLGPYLTILPINSIDLQVKAAGNDASLKWKIEPASDIAWVEVERKTIADNKFVTLQKFYPGTDNYTDRSVLLQNSAVHYRLKVADKDNEIKYSKEVVVKGKAKYNFRIQITRAHLQIISAVNTNGVAEIMSSDGSIKARKQFSGPETFIDIASLPAGTYIVRINATGEQYARKFLKLN